MTEEKLFQKSSNIGSTQENRLNPRIANSLLIYPLLVPFFLSGAAALIAELCWLRILTPILGGSSAALNIVLITFMGGLAIGALLAKVVCRHTERYLLIYIVIEYLLATYFVFSPKIISFLGQEFILLLPDLGFESPLEHLVRALTSGFALLLPTIAMGVTTPLLLTVTIKQFRYVASYTGLLYGINTLGGAVGALLAGCYLILSFGISKTLQVAALFDLLAGTLAVAILLFMREEVYQEETKEASTNRKADQKLLWNLYILAAAGGFFGMALEVIFARFLLFTIGGSYFSHTIIIAGFLTGIVLGSLAIGLLSRWFNPRPIQLSFLFYLLGFSAIASAWLFSIIPMGLQKILVESILLDLHPLTIKFVAVLAVTVFPAMMSGMILPFLVHLTTEKMKDVSNASSRVLAFNTLGAVFGIALTGYVAIKAVGVRNAVFLVSILIFMIALYSIRIISEADRGHIKKAMGIGALGILSSLIFIASIGSIPLITHSVFYNQLGEPDILFYKEDSIASISVLDFPESKQRSLMINGLEETGRHDLHNLNDSRFGIFEHPPSKITYKLKLPENPILSIGIALDPRTWSPDKGDGVLFEIHVVDGNFQDRVFSKYIDPKNDISDRKWHDEVVNLSKYGGKDVDLSFITTPGPNDNPDYDWAMWSDPRLISIDSSPSKQHENHLILNLDTTEIKTVADNYVTIIHVNDRGLLSDIAMLSHPDPKTMFVAGLGSGKTAGTAGLYDGLEIDVVEISPGVISALPFFDRFTYNASNNKQIQLIPGDARHYLLSTKKRYDLITADAYLSALTGTSYLYNVEFFQLCRNRLRPGGRVLIHMDFNSFIHRTVAKSFVEAMPYVIGIYFPYSGRYFLIGANEEIKLPENPWTKWSDNPYVVERLKWYGLSGQDGLSSLQVIDRDELLRKLESAEISTDDHPVIDYLGFLEKDSALTW